MDSAGSKPGTETVGAPRVGWALLSATVVLLLAVSAALVIADRVAPELVDGGARTEWVARGAVAVPTVWSTAWWAARWLLPRLIAGEDDRPTDAARTVVTAASVLAGALAAAPLALERPVAGLGAFAVLAMAGVSGAAGATPSTAR